MHSPHRGSRPHRRRTALALSAAFVAAAPLLAACGNEAHPGAAAVVGDERITVSQLENRVNEVRDAQRDATGGGQRYAQAIAKTGGLTRETLHTMVLDRILDQAAKDAGVSVNRREIQEMRGELEGQTGGAKGLEASWLQQYAVAPERLDESLRSELLAQKLARKIGADMNTKQGQSTFWAALSRASKKLDVDLNPRYGTWDVDNSRRADIRTPWLREVSGQERSV
ncbi:SurA N-terminal domain-containing protein [Streptomyces sp. NA04227]|uniref:SurA N-terminal domain-containing protein n=1 Tax=Streptomyces sp. NA04227 TaxID=2742136 RepID=UPI0020CA80EB|nr:SurA N-terminal domain-containing protein [Streptomyces sp. NA04227]